MGNTLPKKCYNKFILNNLRWIYMAWENFKVEQQRLQLLTAYIVGETSMTDLCIKYGISRRTAYKWFYRFLEEGEAGLKDLSTAPHNPNYLYSEELIQRAI